MPSTKRLVLLAMGTVLSACPAPTNNATPAKAELTASSLDFGSADCGAAEATKSVTLKNTGGSTLTWSVALTGSAFTVKNTGGTLEPGDSIDVGVGFQAPSTSTAGADLTGELAFTTSDDSNASPKVTLKGKARGVTLTLSQAVVAFGVLPVTTPATNMPVTLTNTGNVAATVSVAALTDPQFSLAWSGSPGTISLAPGANVSLTAGFRPAKIQPSSETVALSVAEATCGAALPSLQLTGQGTNGVIAFSTTDVFFGTNGLVDCGTTAAQKTFTITNSGNAAFSWNATLRKGSASPFGFTPTSGTIPANGGTVTITVTTSAIPAAANTAMDAYGDVLDVVTDVANDTIHPISLHQTAHGAVLRFQPTALDFGLVPVNNTSNAQLNVINDGSGDAMITLTSDNAKFTLVPAGPTGSTAGSNLPIAATFAPGSSVVLETANVSLSVGGTDVLCAPLPSATVLTGQGTSGSVSYSPALLDWGGVNCGTTGPTKTLTFKNNGNQAYTISPSLGLGAGSSFTISMAPDSGVADVDGGMVVITVVPAGIPQTSAVTDNLYGDTLTVTTDVSGDSAHSIPLQMTAKGAIFDISTNTLNFGSVTAGATGSTNFTATNNGNAPGGLNFTPGQPAIFQLPTNSTVAANSSASQLGTFTPPSAATYSDTATITKTASTVLCAPLPFTQMSLSGVGSSGNVVALSANSLTFGSAGFTDCGTTATAKTFTVTNNSSGQLAFTYTLAGGNNSPFQVSGPATVAGSGANGTVTVTPNAVPSRTAADGGVDVSPDAFGDTLTVRATGGSVDESHTVALHQTARGAIVSFSPKAITITGTPLGGTKSANFNVVNSGNVQAPYTLTLTGTNFSLAPTSGTATQTTSPQHTVTFSNPLIGGGAKTGNVQYVNSGSAVMCAPLPSNLPLSGS
jgi:hypothetical protein